MYAVVSIYEHDGLEAVVEAVVPSYSVAEGLISEIADFRADQTHGPRIVVAPIVGPIRLSRNERDELLNAARWVVDNWDKGSTQHGSMKALRDAVKKGR